MITDYIKINEVVDDFKKTFHSNLSDLLEQFSLTINELKTENQFLRQENSELKEKIESFQKENGRQNRKIKRLEEFRDSLIEKIQKESYATEKTEFIDANELDEKNSQQIHEHLKPSTHIREKDSLRSSSSRRSQNSLQAQKASQIDSNKKNNEKNQEKSQEMKPEKIVIKGEKRIMEDNNEELEEDSSSILSQESSLSNSSSSKEQERSEHSSSSSASNSETDSHESIESYSDEAEKQNDQEAVRAPQAISHHPAISAPHLVPQPSIQYSVKLNSPSTLKPAGRSSNIATMQYSHSSLTTPSNNILPSDSMPAFGSRSDGNPSISVPTTTFQPQSTVMVSSGKALPLSSASVSAAQSPPHSAPPLPHSSAHITSSSAPSPYRAVGTANQTSSLVQSAPPVPAAVSDLSDKPRPSSHMPFSSISSPIPTNSSFSPPSSSTPPFTYSNPSAISNPSNSSASAIASPLSFSPSEPMTSTAAQSKQSHDEPLRAPSSTYYPRSHHRHLHQSDSLSKHSHHRQHQFTKNELNTHEKRVERVLHSLRGMLSATSYHGLLVDVKEAQRGGISKSTASAKWAKEAEKERRNIKLKEQHRSGAKSSESSKRDGISKQDDKKNEEENQRFDREKQELDQECTEIADLIEELFELSVPSHYHSRNSKM